MSQNEKDLKKRSEYKPLHNRTVISERLRPGRIIRPIVVIVMIIVVMCVYVQIQKKNVVRNAEQVTNQTAEYIAGSIANEMDYAQSSIKFASAAISQSMTSDTLENPDAIIAPMIVNTPFADIEYIRADGMNVVNIGEDFDASDRVYYTEGIKGNTGIWNNYHPKTSQETLMNFYTPIVYQGENVGVLTGYIAATTQLTPLFVTELYGEEVYGLLIDENDMVICSTIASEEYIQDLSLSAFIDQYGIAQDEKARICNAIDAATQEATSFEDSSGQGRICVATIPGTDWKVVIVVPKNSLKAIVNKNTRDAVLTIIIISLILISYATFVLVRNVKRHKEITIENAMLEKENRIVDEENKKVFKEISMIRDINAAANMGTWRMEFVDGQDPRMFVDSTMRKLLGGLDKQETPEETYRNWFERIAPQDVFSVFESVDKMKQGHVDENTYLWNHPFKGERYVRCGGTAKEIPGGYLLSGYHYDVDDVVRTDMANLKKLKRALSEKNDYYNTLGTLADIYYGLYVIDLVKDTFVDFHAKDRSEGASDRKHNATEIMRQSVADLATEEYKEKALGFTDLETLADRMQNRKFRSAQLIGKDIGWFLATFITMDTDADGRPVKVTFTIQIIDQEKKQEELLILRSQTDELTGLLNRRAYEENIYKQDGKPDKDHFVIMSLDVNGLKNVNDTLGHAAGDELLIGASQCMTKGLGQYGKVYRTGGDEFMTILYCDREELKKVLAKFDQITANWKGKLVDSLSISYGYISREEEPEMSVRKLAVIADKRMYEAKTAYYRKIGVDRQGNSDAQRALLDRYLKIMKINITDDTYQIINMDKTEQSPEKGYSDQISLWLSSFAASGQVHPDDLEEYRRKTDMQFMRDYFSHNNSSLTIFYRRKDGEAFKPAMMEIIPADDYSDENQSLYLYVRVM